MSGKTTAEILSSDWKVGAAKDFYKERREDILSRYARGEIMAPLAKAYGISRQMVQIIIDRYATKEMRDGHTLARYGVDYDTYCNRFRGNIPRAATDHDPVMIYKRTRQLMLQRGLEFSIDFDGWWQLWQDSKQWKNRGIRRGQYWIRRKDPTQGYVVGNLEVYRVGTPRNARYDVQLSGIPMAQRRTQPQARSVPAYPTGVSKFGKSYLAKIWIGEKAYKLGNFSSPEVAGEAYRRATLVPRLRIVAGDRSFLTDLR